MKCLFHFFFSAVIFLTRHRKNREAASELLMRLKDNRDLQKFLQDCQEVNYILSLLSLKAASYRKASSPHTHPVYYKDWDTRYFAIKSSRGI